MPGLMCSNISRFSTTEDAVTSISGGSLRLNLKRELLQANGVYGTGGIPQSYSLDFIDLVTNEESMEFLMNYCI